MEGAILSGQLAAKAAAEAILEREKDRTFEEAPKLIRTLNFQTR